MVRNNNHLDDPAQARQQARLWSEQAVSACLERRFIPGLHYYRRALELARDFQMARIHSEICRDLGYIYLHHGQTEQARTILEEGLSLDNVDPDVHFGLLTNRISVYLVKHEYHSALDLTDEAIDYFLEVYPRFEQAPTDMLVSLGGLRKMRDKIAQIVDLIQSGIDPKRLDINFQLSPPPWTR